MKNEDAEVFGISEEKSCKKGVTEKNLPTICPGISVIFGCGVTWLNSGWNSTRPSKGGLPGTFKLRYI